MHLMQRIWRAIPISLLASSLAVLSLGSPGLASWPHTWGGSSDDNVSSVALDPNGNVYIAGSTTSFGAGGTDVLILKYSPSGTLRWAKTWGGGGDEAATRIALGPDGYIYVTGGTGSFGAGWDDIFLLKLNSNGDLQWGLTWGGSSHEYGYDLNFDQAGNIYVVGESYSNGNSAVILKFSPDGGPPIWSASWKGPATYETGYALAVDSNFNVIMAGTSWDYGGPYLHNYILLVKYDSSGNYLWSENWITASPGQDQAILGSTTDSAGNIYVVGDHSGNCPSSNFSNCNNFQAIVLKVDAGGSLAWAQTWGGAGFDMATGMALDPNGHLLVAVGKNRYGATPGVAVLSYDTGGGLLSSVGWAGQEPFARAPDPGLAVDAAGDALVVAGAQNNSGKWAAVAGSVRSLPNSLVINPFTLGTPTGQVTMLTNPTVSRTGVTDTGGGGTDVFVAKYSHLLSGGYFLPPR